MSRDNYLAKLILWVDVRGEGGNSRLENGGRSGLARGLGLVWNRSSLRALASSHTRRNAGTWTGRSPTPGPSSWCWRWEFCWKSRRRRAGRIRRCVRIGLPGRGAGALGRGARGAAGRLAGSAAGGFGGALRFPAADEVGGGVLVRVSLCGAGGGNPLGPGAVHPAGRRGDDGGAAAGHVSWRLRMDGGVLLGGAGGGHVHGRSGAFVHGLPQPACTLRSTIFWCASRRCCTWKRAWRSRCGCCWGSWPAASIARRESSLFATRNWSGYSCGRPFPETASGWLPRISR